MPRLVDTTIRILGQEPLAGLMPTAALLRLAEVLDGAVPHRDFVTFYGPGNPWLVAGAFWIASESVATERAVGLLYRMLIVLSLFVLGMRLGGVLGGVLAGVASAWVMSEEIVWAYATYGAIAFGLASVALAAWAPRLPRAGRGLAGHLLDR